MGRHDCALGVRDGFPLPHEQQQEQQQLVVVMVVWLLRRLGVFSLYMCCYVISASLLLPFFPCSLCVSVCLSCCVPSLSCSVVCLSCSVRGCFLASSSAIRSLPPDHTKSWSSILVHLSLVCSFTPTLCLFLRPIPVCQPHTCLVLSWPFAVLRFLDKSILFMIQLLNQPGSWRSNTWLLTLYGPCASGEGALLVLRCPQRFPVRSRVVVAAAVVAFDGSVGSVAGRQHHSRLLLLGSSGHLRSLPSWFFTVCCLLACLWVCVGYVCRLWFFFVLC